jgi:uncharacterized membrane protein
MRHPLHPALVHFPIACWSLATIADLAGLAYGKTVWDFASALMAIGVVTALAAMTTGLFELVKLGDGHAAEGDVQRHMGWALAAFACYVASLFLRLRGLHPVAPGVPALALSVVGFACLGVAGWMGGKLVYAHRLGGDARGGTDA